MPRFFKRIWSRLFSAKRPFKLTRAGWVFILYTIGVGAGAINTGNNLLYLVFGVFLGLLVASGLLSDLSLWGLDVEWRFPYVGTVSETSHILVTLANQKKRLPSLAVHVQIEGRLRDKKKTLSAYVPFISALQKTTARIELTPEMRGWFQLESVKVVTRYPFGLLQKWWTLRREEEKVEHRIGGDPEEGMFVTPALVPVDLSDVPALSQGDDELSRVEQRGDGTTIHGVRDYRPGDNPRRIHWKASAKRVGSTASLEPSWLVRETEIDQKKGVVLVCPAAVVFKMLKDEEIERFLSYLASLMREYADNDYAFRLVFPHGGDFQRAYLSTIRENEGGPRLEWEFLSLWNPTQPPGTDIFGYLDTITLRDVPASFERVDVMKGFREWKPR